MRLALPSVFVLAGLVGLAAPRAFGGDPSPAPVAPPAAAPLAPNVPSPAGPTAEDGPVLAPADAGGTGVAAKERAPRTLSPVQTIAGWMARSLGTDGVAGYPNGSADEQVWRAWFAAGADTPLAPLRDALVADGWTADRFLAYFAGLRRKSDAIQAARAKAASGCGGAGCCKGTGVRADGKPCCGGCGSKPPPAQLPPPPPASPPPVPVTPAPTEPKP